MAAVMVSMPAKSHATSSQPGLWMIRAISAGTRKMPEPIMAPATIIDESNRPSWRLNPDAAGFA
jgi:hypothetical protein